MNNDLEQFSEERLMKLSEYDCAGAEEVCSLARIALAAKQAKPVGYFRKMPNDSYYQLSKSTVAMDQIPLYTTPQPAHTEWDGWIEFVSDIAGDTHQNNSLRDWAKKLLAAAPKPESE